MVGGGPIDFGGSPKIFGAALVGGGWNSGFKGGRFGASFTCGILFGACFAGCGFKGGVGGFLNITAVSAVAGGS